MPCLPGLMACPKRSPWLQYRQALWTKSASNLSAPTSRQHGPLLQSCQQQQDVLGLTGHVITYMTLPIWPASSSIHSDSLVLACRAVAKAHIVCSRPMARQQSICGMAWHRSAGGQVTSGVCKASHWCWRLKRAGSLIHLTTRLSMSVLIWLSMLPQIILLAAHEPVSLSSAVPL